MLLIRYSEAVNVIGFLYSVFQFFAIAAHLTRKKHLIPRPKGDYFDFAMDQVCLSEPLAPFRRYL
jgi:hypothetical protein